MKCTLDMNLIHLFHHFLFDIAVLLLIIFHDFYRKVELPFQWMVYKPIMPKTGPCEPQNSLEVQPSNQQEEDRVPDMEAAFSVFPNNGILQPSETAQFRVTFAPPNVSGLSFNGSKLMILNGNKYIYIYIYIYI